MGSTNLSNEQIKAVKGQGFLHNRGTTQFSGRILTKNGVIKASQMMLLSQAAEKYGNGNITFTVRLTVEVPGIEYEDIESFRKFIASAGMVTGGTGAKVRPVVACKGTTCMYGLCDTQQLASEIHTRFYEGYHNTILPHKFKIAVGGCPNNCAKPDLNDLGIVGRRVTKINYDECRACKKCFMSTACPMNAIDMKNRKISIDPQICNNCGRCVGKCPFKVSDQFEDRFKIYVGGRWGKRIRIGTPLDSLFTKEDALNIIEKCILLFKSEGVSGERFGETCDRLGIENVNNMLSSNTLLNSKESIQGIEHI